MSEVEMVTATIRTYDAREFAVVSLTIRLSESRWLPPLDFCVFIHPKVGEIAPSETHVKLTGGREEGTCMQFRATQRKRKERRKIQSAFQQGWRGGRGADLPKVTRPNKWDHQENSKPTQRLTKWDLEQMKKQKS